jgi:hypothetical protein
LWWFIIQTRATKKAAESALKQANYMIASERPWMRIEPKCEKIGEHRIYTFECVNRGKSPAIIVNKFSRFRMVAFEKSDDLPTQPEYGKLATPDWEILHQLWFMPGESFEVDQFNTLMVLGDGAPEWKSIKELKKRLYFIGIVRYRDTLSPEIHESRYCYAAASGGTLVPFGTSSEYNKMT